MPKQCKLLSVSPEGYLVQVDQDRLLIPHEALVAVLHGLCDVETIQQAGVSDWSLRSVQDACKHARHQLSGLAWVQKVCSWSNDFRPVEYTDSPFFVGE